MDNPEPGHIVRPDAHEQRVGVHIGRSIAVRGSPAGRGAERAIGDHTRAFPEPGRETALLVPRLRTALWLFSSAIRSSLTFRCSGFDHARPEPTGAIWRAQDGQWPRFSLQRAELRPARGCARGG